MGVKNRLKEIRMKEYMVDNKSEFARMLGVDTKTYNGWETNASRPKLEVALEIAEKLNRDIKDIWYLEK